MSYKSMKFRMKLAYEAWTRSIEIISLIYFGVCKTLQQKLRVATYKLRRVIVDPKFNSQHHLFSDEDEVPENTDLDSLDVKRLQNHITIMSYQVKTGLMQDIFTKHDAHLQKRRIAYLGRRDTRNEIQSTVESMETYGNLLYEFCLYRSRLTIFNEKKLWIRKIKSLMNLTYEISRAITKDDSLPYI